MLYKKADLHLIYLCEVENKKQKLISEIVQKITDNVLLFAKKGETKYYEEIFYPLKEIKEIKLIKEIIYSRLHITFPDSEITFEESINQTHPSSMIITIDWS